MDYTKMRHLIPDCVWSKLLNTWNDSRSTGKTTVKIAAFSETLAIASSYIQISYDPKAANFSNRDTINQIIDCLDLIHPDWRGYPAPLNQKSMGWARNHLSQISFAPESKAA